MGPQPLNPVPVFADGRISFVVRGVEDRTYDLDLLEVKLTCEEVEAEHRLVVKDGRVHPTTDFLRELAGRLKTLGLDGCTSTVAWQVWISTRDLIELLKKNTNETPKSPSGMESTPPVSTPKAESDLSPICPA